MSQTTFLVSGIILVTLIASISLFVIQTAQKETVVACTMDAKICPDGNTVGRVPPTCEFALCPLTEPVPVITPISTDPIRDAIVAHADLIVLETPTAYATITSPVILTGKARGTWYFEGSFPIVIIAEDGAVLGEGYATAESEWMTEDFVPFSATTTFSMPSTTPPMPDIEIGTTTSTTTKVFTGSIVLKKDNPSGLPENDDSLIIPVQF